MIKLFIFGLFLIGGCGRPISEKKDSAKIKNALTQSVSEELILDINMSLNFDLLPLSGKTREKEKFWSGDSWRLNRGAVNFRWNSDSPESFNYHSPGSREVSAMTIVDLKKLSPSEKYDIFKGRYDYPLKNEVDWLARSGIESWEGLCHGWAGASMNHERPVSKVMVNPDGINVPFGVSDIKALLTYTYSKFLIGEGQSKGKRCENDSTYIDENCDDDLTAVAFHAVLTNKLGLRGESFIADIDRFKEVWNHPIISFESKIQKMIATRGGRTAIVLTKLSYIDVVEKNSWESLPDVISYMTVKYELKIDHDGNLVSGSWLSRERPDFVWTVSRPEVFSGYLADIQLLLEK